MRKTFIAVLAIALQLAAGCAPYLPQDKPGPNFPDFTITYTFVTVDVLTQKPVSVPITMGVLVPGFAVWTSVSPTTPATLTIPAKDYPPVEKNSSVIGTVTGRGSDSTFLACSWSANTAAGARSSADSRGGEGSGTGPFASATCTYAA